MEKPKYKLVEVIWEDITHLQKVRDIEMIDDKNMIEFRNLGYLIKEDEKRIVICFAMMNNQEENGIWMSEDAFRDVLIIPKGNIKSIEILKSLDLSTNHDTSNNNFPRKESEK